MLKLLLPLAALLLLCGAARADDAQDAHSRSAAGIRSSFYKPDDAGSSTWGAGGQARLRLGGGYALEASLDQSHYRAGHTDFREWPLQFSLLGFSPLGNSPTAFYGLLGYGWYFRSVLGPAAHTETLTHPHVGFGLQILAGDNWSIDGSYRYLWSCIYRYNDWEHPWGSRYQYRGQMFTLGFNRLF